MCSPSPGPCGVSKGQSHCGRGAELIEGAWNRESEKYLPSQCSAGAGGGQGRGWGDYVSTVGSH